MSKQLTMAGLLGYRGGGKGPPPPPPPGFDPFEFDGQPIRVGMLDGEPIWCSSDVAKALGYVDPDQAARQHCKRLKLFKPVELTGMGISNPPPRGLNMIREPDLYRLIINSHLPAADRFEQWVFETVLPTIRKTGSYSFGQSLPPPPPPPPPLPRGPVVLSPDAMTALGGLVKNSAPRAVMQAIALVAHQNEEMKAALRHCGMLVPPEQVASVFWPMRDVAKRECVTGKRVVHRMSMSMRNWCIEQGRQACVRKVSDIHGRTCLVFHIDAVDDWLADLRKQAGAQA